MCSGVVPIRPPPAKPHKTGRPPGPTNGAPVALTYSQNAADDGGSYTVQASGVAATKYAYLFRGKDLAGTPVSLFVPFWVEAAPFARSLIKINGVPVAGVTLLLRFRTSRFD